MGVGAFNFVEGSIDVSGLTSGTVHFFFSGYRSTPYFDASIKDTDGGETELPLFDFGDDGGSTNRYASSIEFTNPTGYDTIDWYFSGSLYSGAPHCSLAGIVVTGVSAGLGENARHISANQLK